VDALDLIVQKPGHVAPPLPLFAWGIEVAFFSPITVRSYKCWMRNRRCHVAMVKRISFVCFVFAFLAVLYFTAFILNRTLSISLSRNQNTLESIYSLVSFDYNHFGNLSPESLSRRLDIRIAYFIQVSGSNLHLFPRLLYNLYDTRHVYGIHFDCPCNQSVVGKLVAALEQADLSNIHIIPQEALTYSGISLVLNTLSAMTLLLKYPAGIKEPKEWDFFINLSGSDYPLLTPCDQARVLGEAVKMVGDSTDINFLQMFDKHDSDYRRTLLYIDPALTWNKLVSMNCLSKEALKPVQLHPFQHYFNFSLYKAEAWMILSRETVRYLTCESFPRWMLATFVNTVSSPEHYFATVLKSSAMWKNTIVPFAFRYVRWIHPKLHRSSTQHPFELDRYDDLFWDDIYYSSCFFARKFSQQDSLLHSRIDSVMAGLNSTLLHEALRQVRIENATSVCSILSKKKQFLEDKHFSHYFCCIANGSSHFYRTLDTMQALIRKHFP